MYNTRNARLPRQPNRARPTSRTGETSTTTTRKTRLVSHFRGSGRAIELFLKQHPHHQRGRQQQEAGAYQSGEVSRSRVNSAPAVRIAASGCALPPGS